jgi:excisionase family DNA binding protein
MVREKSLRVDEPLRPTKDPAALVADGLLTVRECAEFLHLSRSKVYELMNAGILCYAKLGRSRRIPRRAVIELAAQELRGGRRQSR